MQQEIQIPSLQCNVLYTIGKNSQSNFDIIDAASPNDLWFHIQGESSCHVIASIPLDKKLDKKQLRQIVTQGAVLCKSKSRYKSNKNVSIIYTKVENVTKSDPVGTVIAENIKTIVI